MLETFHLENNGFDPIRAAGDEVIFILHPGTEIAFEHQGQQNLVDIVPGPVTIELNRMFDQIMEATIIPHFEKRTQSVLDIRPAIFDSQFGMIPMFRNGDLASWKSCLKFAFKPVERLEIPTSKHFRVYPNYIPRKQFVSRILNNP